MGLGLFYYLAGRNGKMAREGAVLKAWQQGFLRVFRRRIDYLCRAAENLSVDRSIMHTVHSRGRIDDDF